MSNRLYISDLDGTLLQPNGSLSEFSKNTLNALLDGNMSIAFATARSKYKVVELLKGLNLFLPYISLNGVQLIDGATNKSIQEYILPLDLTKEVIDLSKTQGLYPFILGEHNNADILTYNNIKNLMMEKFINQRKGDRRLHCSEGKDFFPDKVFVLNFLGRKEQIEDLQSNLLQRFPVEIKTNLVREIYIDNCYSLEIRDRQADKSIMVYALCEILDTTVDNVVYFGDELNDLEIFEVVGKKIAVENAHESIKLKADEVIASNNMDGVAKYLDFLFKEGDNG